MYDFKKVAVLTENCCKYLFKSCAGPANELCFSLEISLNSSLSSLEIAISQHWTLLKKVVKIPRYQSNGKVMIQNSRKIADLLSVTIF